MYGGVGVGFVGFVGGGLLVVLKHYTYMFKIYTSYIDLCLLHMYTCNNFLHTYVHVVVLSHTLKESGDRKLRK